MRMAPASQGTREANAVKCPALREHFGADNFLTSILQTGNQSARDSYKFPRLAAAEPWAGGVPALSPLFCGHRTVLSMCDPHRAPVTHISGRLVSRPNRRVPTSQSWAHASTPSVRPGGDAHMHPHVRTPEIKTPKSGLIY